MNSDNTASSFKLRDYSVDGGNGNDLQKAIDTAFAAGGGRVVVKAGEYRSGSLRLRSHVELHLEKGVTIIGGAKSEDYFDFPVDVCAVRPENSAKVFLYAWDSEDISITGEGVIEGQGPEFFDRSSLAFGGSHWAKPPYPRPRMVQFVRCRNIRLEGVTFKDSPGWTMLIRLCTDVAVENIRVLADQRIINSDGIDFDGCRHVRVRRSYFKTGDDCLIVRAMREAGSYDHIVCEDVVFEDCDLDSTCQIIRMGCPSDDIIRDIRIRNIRGRGLNGINFDYPARYLRPDDDGYMDISDVVIENLTGEFYGMALRMVVEPGVKLRNVSDIRFYDVDVKSHWPVEFIGNADSPLKKILLENVTVTTPDGGNAWKAVATEPLFFRDCTFNGKREDDRDLFTPRGERQPLVRSVVSWETKSQKKSGSERTLAGGVPLLKFGVISDIHVIAENTDRRYNGNNHYFKKALRWFDEQGVDAVVNPGDLADCGLVSQLETVASGWYEVFPDDHSRRDGRKVEKLFIYGNHDYEGFYYGATIFGVPAKDLIHDRIVENGLAKSWEEAFHEKYEPIYRRRVKGFDFIGAHWDPVNGSAWGEGPDLKSYMAENGSSFNPDMPFFVIQHPHPKDTCYGPWAWGHDSGNTTEALSAYPNAVVFSGHSHYSLLDERSVWQGAFTSIGTASLRYEGDPFNEFLDEGGFENTSGGNDVRPNAEKMMEPFTGAHKIQRSGLLVSVYSDNIVIQRRDFIRDCPLGPDWVIPLPVAEKKPFAFAEQVKRSKAPEFPEGANVKVTAGEAPRRKDYSGDEPKGKVPALIVAFPAAVQTFDGRVWRYDVACETKDGNKLFTRHILSPDFHLPVEMADKEIVLPVNKSELSSGTEVRFVITPVNSVGKCGPELVSAWLAV